MSERDLQAECVKWFRSIYKPNQAIIFSVPNEATYRRSNYYKGAGMLPGTSDLVIVFKAEKKVMFIEMKCKGGRQTLEQKGFQAVVEHMGYQYYVCRSLSEFQYRVKHAFDREPSEPPVGRTSGQRGRRDQKRAEIISSCDPTL